MILKNHRDLTAIFLSLIPFLVFLSIENLKQMIDNEIYFLLINSLWTFFILILAQFLKKIFFISVEHKKYL